MSRIHLLPILCICLFFTLSLKAQNGNPCGVKAVISPAGDSVISSPTAVFFQSASINATDYRLIFDIYQYPLNTPINWGIPVGLTAVKLVAYNGPCTDTAVVYYFYPGQFPSPTDNSRRLYGYAARDQEVTSMAGIKTGGYILTGHRFASSFFNERQQGLMIKTKEEGCVDWGRKLQGTYESDIRMVKESADGGYFLLADIDFNRP